MGTEWGAGRVQLQPSAPGAVWHGCAGTHVCDDFELADVGSLGVQQLPDGFLLVALPT